MSLAQGGPVFDSTTPLHVAHFILDHRVGGPHVYVRTLLNAQTNCVVGTLVTAGSGGYTDVALLNLRRLHRLLYPVEVLVNAVLIALRWGILKRPDLLHVHGAANTAPLLGAVLARLPVVWHLHETVEKQRRLASIGRWLLGHVPHGILTVASQARVAFGVPEAVLAPGAVDTQLWMPTTSGDVTSQPPASAALRLVSVGNLNPLKGQDLLLDALATVRAPIALVLVGAELSTQSDYAAQLRSRVTALASRTPAVHVRFGGSQSAPEVRETLLNSDLFVLPSRSEACPIALLEAMAMAMPCIAADTGDVRTMLPTAHEQQICPPNNPAALARLIDGMFKMPIEERRQLGRANRRAVETHHSPAALAATVLTCYRTLLCRKK